MKIKDFHTRVCAASGSNIGSLATPGGRGMRASFQQPLLPNQSTEGLDARTKAQISYQPYLPQKIFVLFA